MGKNRCKPNSRAIPGGEHHIIYPEITKARKKSSMAVRKKDTGFSFNTLIDPYPSLGRATEGKPSPLSMIEIRKLLWSSMVLTVL